MPKEVSLRPEEEGSDDSEGESDDDYGSSNHDDHDHDHDHDHDDHDDSDDSDNKGDNGSYADRRSPDQASSVDDFYYPTGLVQLQTELEAKYAVHNISSMSYALAADLNCLDQLVPLSEQERQQGQIPPARCLLADRNRLAREYRGARDFTFYPLAFHPAYGNFSSARPPAFLNNNVLTVMRDNMSYLNGGADVLTAGYSQGYSNVKRAIRHGPKDLLPTKGVASGALTLPESEAAVSTRVQAKRQCLRRQLLGQTTPNDPGASQPFVRERRRIEAAVEAQEFAFRLEQVIHVQVSRLTRARR